jgi:hypothetical protein
VYACEISTLPADENSLKIFNLRLKFIYRPASQVLKMMNFYGSDLGFLNVNFLKQSQQIFHFAIFSGAFPLHPEVSGTAVGSPPGELF